MTRRDVAWMKQFSFEKRLLFLEWRLIRLWSLASAITEVYKIVRGKDKLDRRKLLPISEVVRPQI